LQPKLPLLLSGGIVEMIINLGAFVTYGKPDSQPGKNSRELGEMHKNKQNKLRQ